MAASAVIGALRADLTLNSAQFTNGVRQAQGSMNNLRATMRALGAAAAALGAALGGIGSAAADNAQEILRLSRMTKTQPEEFQRWAAAARDVGIEQDLLGDILKDFNEKMGEYVSTGGGGMADFFEQVVPKLGKSADEVARQFAGLSGADGMQLYVDMLEQAGVGHKQMTFYMESAASDMSRLLPIMTDTGKGMEALADAAERSGAVISTGALLELEKAGVAIDGMRIALQGMITEIGGAAAPAITAIANAFSSTFQEGGLVNTVLVTLSENITRIGYYAGAAAVSFGVYTAAMTVAAIYTAGLSAALVVLRAAIVRTGIGILIVGIGELAYQFSRVTEATGSAGEAARLFGRVAAAVANATIYAMGYAADRILAGFIGAFQGTVAAFQSLPDILGAIGRLAAAKLIQALGNGLVNGLPKVVDGTIAWVNEKLGEIDPRLALSRLPKAMVSDVFEFDTTEYENEAAAALSSAGKNIAGAFGEGYGKTRIEFGKVFDVGDVSTEFGKITTALDSVGDAAEEAIPPVSNLHDELFGLIPPEEEKGAKGGGPGAAKEAIKELGEEAKEAVNPMEFLRDSLADVFAAVVTGAKSAREGIGELLKKMAQMIANKAFTSLFDSVIGNGGGFGNVLTFLGIGANANGTPNWRGGLSLVGERGPELVNLPRGSGVITAQRTGRLLEGAGGGGRMIVELSPDLVGRVLEEANQGAIQVTRAGLEQFSSEILPRRQMAVAQDPRRRG